MTRQDHTLTMPEAARLVGKLTHSRPPHIATLHRWADRGVVGPAGRRVFLETLKFGRRRVTTREAVIDFATQLAAGKPSPDAPQARPRLRESRPTRARRARVERALAALREI